jgi:hypothetical protein
MAFPPGLEWFFASRGWVPWLPVQLLSAFAVLACMVAVYWAVLPFQGRLLQRRQLTILAEVTEDIE